MENLSVQVPALYGDHHVSAVRAILLGMPGVQDVYASSSFQLIEMTYDETVVTGEAILAQLEEAGYLSELDVPHESGEVTVKQSAAKAFYRHTVAHASTGRIIGFSQEVPSAGRALWPCPGIGLLESAKEELQNG
jgi:copper chaperone CopZ